MRINKIYFAWMLRITRIGSGENHVWRASLEDPHTRERVGFDSKEALYEHIQHCIDTSDPNHADERQAATPQSVNLKEILK